MGIAYSCFLYFSSVPCCCLCCIRKEELCVTGTITESSGTSEG